MDACMPAEILAGLERARKAAEKRRSRLRVASGDDEYPILRIWEGGFAVADADAAHLRGTVEVRDGARVLHECLVICATREGGEVTYEVKRLQRADGEQPVDFERDEAAPVALLPRK